MTRRRLLLFLVVGALAAATTWLSRETRQEARQAVTRGVPDYFVNNFTALQLGPDGRRVRRLEAAHLAHFPDRQMYVKEPHLTLFQPDGPPWEMTSADGTLDDRGELVQLAGNVHLYRKGPEAADFRTATLRLEPPRDYAETADPVTMTTARGRVEAVGMRAWLDDQRVVLTSRVKGTYDPKVR